MAIAYQTVVAMRPAKEEDGKHCWDHDVPAHERTV
jgi:hypothetical protein